MLYGEGFERTMMHGIMENCSLWLGSLLMAAPALKAILLLFLWSWLLSTRRCLAPNAGACGATAGRGTGSV